MGILKKDSNEIIRICEELKHVNSDAEKIIVNYHVVLETLDSAWEGEEKAIFENYITKYLKNMEQLVRACDQYCEVLSNLANRYCVAESSFASNIANAIQSDIIE